MSELDRLRQLLEALEPEDLEEQAPADAAEFEDRLRAATDIVPSDETVQFLNLISEPPSGSAEDESARARARVERARDSIKSHRQDVAKVLSEARHKQGLSVQAAASSLGINRQAVNRIEQGQLALLANLDPRLVAGYIRQLGIDAMNFIRGVFPLPSAEAVYGYTPRTPTEEQELAQSQVAARDARRDFEWIGQFLRSSGVPFG